MDLINSFISTYGTTILYTVLTGVASFIGLKVKGIYEKYINDKTKRNIVESTVKYVEQIYYELSGPKVRKGQRKYLSSINGERYKYNRIRDGRINRSCL